MLVILGSNFATGQDANVAKRFRELETWTRQNLDVGDVAWRWVNEDYDRVPFAGREPQAPDLYIATGFNACGTSNGTAAGILIAEQILGRALSWASVYDPACKAPDGFNRGGDSHSIVHSLDDIEPGGAGVMNLGQSKIAVWKDLCSRLPGRRRKLRDQPLRGRHGAKLPSYGGVLEGGTGSWMLRAGIVPAWRRALRPGATPQLELRIRSAFLVLSLGEVDDE